MWDQLSLAKLLHQSRGRAEGPRGRGTRRVGVCSNRAESVRERRRSVSAGGERSGEVGNWKL